MVSYHTADSKRVKQEVNRTVILPPLVFPARCLIPEYDGHLLHRRRLSCPKKFQRTLVRLWRDVALPLLDEEVKDR